MKIYAKWISKEGQREAMNTLPSLRYSMRAGV